MFETFEIAFYLTYSYKRWVKRFFPENDNDCLSVHCTKNSHWKICGGLARKTSKHMLSCSERWINSRLCPENSASPFPQIGQWNSVFFWEHNHSSQSWQNLQLSFQGALARAMIGRIVFNSLVLMTFASLTVISASGLVVSCTKTVDVTTGQVVLFDEVSPCRVIPAL